MGHDLKKYKWASYRKISMDILETWSNIKKKIDVILQWDITM